MRLKKDLSHTAAAAGLNRGNHGAGFTSKIECQLEAMDIYDIRQIVVDAFEQNLNMPLLNQRIKEEQALKEETLEILLKRNRK